MRPKAVSGRARPLSFYLVDAAEVAAAFKSGVQEQFRDVEGHALAGHALAKTEHVGVVVLAGGAGLKFASAQRRADAGDVVGGHAHADARPAHEDPERGGFVAGRGVARVGKDFAAYALGIDGVVAAFRGGGAEVVDIMPFFGKALYQRGLEFQSGVIGADIAGSHRFPVFF